MDKMQQTFFFFFTILNGAFIVSEQQLNVNVIFNKCTDNGTYPEAFHASNPYLCRRLSLFDSQKNKN